MDSSNKSVLRWAERGCVATSRKYRTHSNWDRWRTTLWSQFPRFECWWYVNVKTYVMNICIWYKCIGKSFSLIQWSFSSAGQLEIVVSFYDTEKDGDDEGFLVAYELTDFDWKIAENWKRHVLADSFTTNFFIFGNTMSPGKHRTFYPSRYYCKSSTEM